MTHFNFSTTTSFLLGRAKRVSILLLFVGVIFVSRAYQPLSTICKPKHAIQYQRYVSLKLHAESNTMKSSIKLFIDEVSDETRIKGNSIETVSSSPIFERVQRGLAGLTEIIPKPIRLAVVAVASSLLLFELSKTLLFLAVPIIAVLGKCCISWHKIILYCCNSNIDVNSRNSRNALYLRSCRCNNLVNLGLASIINPSVKIFSTTDYFQSSSPFLQNHISDPNPTINS